MTAAYAWIIGWLGGWLTLCVAMFGFGEEHPSYPDPAWVWRAAWRGNNWALADVFLYALILFVLWPVLLLTSTIVWACWLLRRI